MLKKILKISRSFVVPGPGMYDIKTKNKGIRYTMGYRRDQKIKSLKSPSVGDYDLRRDDDLVVPSIIFGREKREVSETNEKVPRTPGPGYYCISTEVTSSSSPKWSFSPINQSLEKSKRKREEESKSPGPGSYNIEGFIGKEGKMFSPVIDSFVPCSIILPFTIPARLMEGIMRSSVAIIILLILFSILY